MGVSKYTPNATVQRYMGWKTAGHRQKLCVLRLAKAHEYGQRNDCK